MKKCQISLYGGLGVRSKPGSSHDTAVIETPRTQMGIIYRLHNAAKNAMTKDAIASMIRPRKGENLHNQHNTPFEKSKPDYQ